MVVQCPNCQTKFRIADDKVTDKGVRVRCTSCKNVFQVKKSGTENAASQVQSGTTQELQALSPGQLGSSVPPPKPATLPPAPRAAAPGIAPPARAPAPSASARSATPVSSPSLRPAAAPPPGRPTPALSAASAPGALGRRRSSAFSLDEEPGLDLPLPPPPVPGRPRPSADDLFGMHELTGESTALPGSPLSSNPNLGRQGRPIPPSGQPLPPPPPAEAMPPPPPDELADDDEADGSGATDGTAPVKLATIKPARRDPFEGLELAGKPHGDGAKDSAAKSPRPEPPLQRPVQRELVAVLLTGLIGVALALALSAAISFAKLSPPWMHEGPLEPVVATQIASGLYDISSSKPLFFIRGRVENRGSRTVGPVRVLAELVGDSGPVARAEAMAGSEPSPEELHALRNPADANAMARELSRSGSDKKLAPGESLPFFALISEPPADAESDELRLRIEAKDAH